jgi:RsiW-degrading membrane proteinase PrsW (M82 family)
MLPRMPPWSTIVAGFAPSLFWLWLVHRRDDNEREPILLVLAAMVLGSGSAMVVLWLRPWLEATWAPLDHTADAFLVTALAEEIAKTLFVLPLLWMREVDEPLDGIVYGVAAALGFAGVENTLWADTSHQLEVVLHRAFTSTLLHAGCTGSIGFAIVCCRLRAFGPRARALLLLLLPLCAVLLHGAYDWCLIADVPHVRLALMAVLPLTLALLWVKMSWARARSESYHPPKA